MASLASRLGVTVPASSGTTGKRGGSNSGSNGGRATPSSRSNKPSRPSPYSKSPPTASFGSARSGAPTARASASAPAQAGNGVDGKWERDLFNPLSDLYNPSVNTEALDRPATSRTSSGSGLFGKALGGIAQPSASLRPFGSASPSVASASANSARNAAALSGSGASAPSGGDLFGRLGMNGASTATSRHQQQQAAEAQAQAKLSQEREERRTRQLAIAEREKQARERDEERKALRAREAELALQRADIEAKEEAMRLRMLEHEAERSRYQEEEAERARQKKAASAVNVLVANLVDGTTPEDVKAAFGDFGEIGECKVLSSNGDTLTMQVEFLNRDDATVAVSKLECVHAGLWKPVIRG